MIVRLPESTTEERRIGSETNLSWLALNVFISDEISKQFIDTETVFISDFSFFFLYTTGKLKFPYCSIILSAFSSNELILCIAESSI